MWTEQKAERGISSNGEKSPATAKSTGKRIINNHDAPEKAPIVRCSSFNSHNHESNEAKSTIKSSEEEQVEVSGEVIVVDDSLQVPLETNGVDVSKKKLKDEIEDDESGLLYQIPMNRVSRIVKSEYPNVRVTQEAVYIINRASEKFLKVFSTEAYASAFLDRKKHIDYKHLSSVVGKRKRFDFLSDFVPEKLKAEDALKESLTLEN